MKNFYFLFVAIILISFNLFGLTAREVALLLEQEKYAAILKEYDAGKPVTFTAAHLEELERVAAAGVDVTRILSLIDPLDLAEAGGEVTVQLLSDIEAPMAAANETAALSTSLPMPMSSAAPNRTVGPPSVVTRGLTGADLGFLVAVAFGAKGGGRGGSSGRK